MTALLTYNWFWLLVLAATVSIFAPPLYGIWHELRKRNEADEYDHCYFRKLPDDEVEDLFDEMVM